MNYRLVVDLLYGNYAGRCAYGNRSASGSNDSLQPDNIAANGRRTVTATIQTPALTTLHPSAVDRALDGTTGTGAAWLGQNAFDGVDDNALVGCACFWFCRGLLLL